MFYKKLRSTSNYCEESEFDSDSCINHRKVIYKITCISTKRFYIGMSMNFNVRITTHINNLSFGIHHSKLMQEDFKNYGLENFKFEIIKEYEDIAVEELRKNEAYYIKLYAPEYNKLNNISAGNFTKTPDIKDSLNIEENFVVLILKALKESSSYKEASDKLGISERTLYRKIKEYKLVNTKLTDSPDKES